MGLGETPYKRVDMQKETGPRILLQPNKVVVLPPTPFTDKEDKLR